MSADKEDTRLLLLVGLAIALFAYLGGYKIAKHHFENNHEKVTDTLIVERWDTLIVEKPTEIVRYVVRHDTIRSVGNPNEPLKPQIVIIDDSTAVVPIEQAVYSDSTENARYTAFVSGFRASLDSISIECKSKETIITNTITKQPRRIGFGVQCGVGVSPQGLATPYIGLGVQYRIW